jgi:uncharacterized protein YbjT (DUF2867 family)
MSSKKTILVLGATGHQGRVVLKRLNAHKAQHYEVYGLVKSLNDSKAKELLDEGIKLIEGDFDDINSLEKAFKIDGHPVHTIFNVQNFSKVGREGEIRQATNVIQAASKVGVKQFIYSSLCSCETTNLPVFECKREVETELRNAGFQYWTVIRPVYWMDNLLLDRDIKEGLRRGVLRMALKPTQKLQTIALEDVAAFVQKVICEPEKFNQRCLEIAGDEQTMEEYARILGVKFEELPLESISDPHLREFFKWLGEKGFEADVNETKRLHPDLISFKEWTEKNRSQLGVQA